MYRIKPTSLGLSQSADEIIAALKAAAVTAQAKANNANLIIGNQAAIDKRYAGAYTQALRNKLAADAAAHYTSAAIAAWAAYNDAVNAASISTQIVAPNISTPVIPVVPPAVSNIIVQSATPNVTANPTIIPPTVLPALNFSTNAVQSPTKETAPWLTYGLIGLAAIFLLPKILKGR